MQVLVAEDDFATRVMMETALRERGLSVRNCEDGLEAAKLLAAPGGPRMAVLSNKLRRLRGLDVSRFLCAMGRKAGVYIILLTDAMETELVELARRAGIDDVVPRATSAPGFAVRVDLALRVVDMEDELARVQRALKGLANVGTSVDRRNAELKTAHAALIGGKSPAAAAPAPAEEPAPAARARQRPLTRPPFQVQEPAAAPAQRTPAKPASTAKGAPAAPAKPHPASNGAPASREQEAAIHDILSVGERETHPGAAPLEVAPPPEVADAAAADPETADDAVLSEVEHVRQVEQEADELDRIIHPFEFDELILGVFSGMGVTLKTQIPAAPITTGPLYVAWVGIAMPARGSWLDILLLAGEAAAQEVTRAILGQATVAGADVCEMFAELQNMAQGSVRRHLEEGGHHLVQLAIPRARLDAAPPALPEDEIVVDSGFTFNGEPINAYLFEHRAPTDLTRAADVQRFDLVCDALSGPDGTPVEAFPAGTLVRDAQLNQLAKLDGSLSPFRVVRPSPVARTLDVAQLLA